MVESVALKFTLKRYLTIIDFLTLRYPITDETKREKVLFRGLEVTNLRPQITFYEIYNYYNQIVVCDVVVSGDGIMDLRAMSQRWSFL